MGVHGLGGTVNKEFKEYKELQEFGSSGAAEQCAR
jgi:hypothetical protein